MEKKKKSKDMCISKYDEIILSTKEEKDVVSPIQSTCLGITYMMDYETNSTYLIYNHWSDLVKNDISHLTKRSASKILASCFSVLHELGPILFFREIDFEFNLAIR